MTTQDQKNFQFQSDQIDQIAIALSKAQGQMESAKKDSKNPFYKNTYADLASVWDAIKEPLVSNGLSVVQHFMYDHDKTILLTTLVHASGQWIRSYLPVVPTKQDVQGMGGGITYMRRYALAAIVGCTQDDDDGESAGTIDRKKKKTVSDIQYQELTSLLEMCPPDYQSRFNERLFSRGINSIQLLPEPEFENVKLALIKIVDQTKQLVINGDNP